MTRGAALPATPDGRFYPMVMPRPDEPVKATLLSDKPFGVWLHYRDGGAVPCTGDPHTCERCAPDSGSRWQGYIACWDWRGRRLAVLCLSEGACRQLLPTYNKARTLRGVTATFTRRDRTRANSPVDVVVHGYEDESRIPPEFELADSLRRLWYWQGPIPGLGEESHSAPHPDEPPQVVSDDDDRARALADPPTPEQVARFRAMMRGFGAIDV